MTFIQNMEELHTYDNIDLSLAIFRLSSYVRNSLMIHKPDIIKHIAKLGDVLGALLCVVAFLS